MTTNAIRGRILHFIADPATTANAYAYLEDGVITFKNGLITACGPAAEILPPLESDVSIDHYPDGLILPGFIDLHIHLPQTQVIASYGTELLEWLEKYTFVEEQRFADPAHAARMAGFFLDTLLGNGTTTAVVYGSVHPGSAEALFQASEVRGTRMIGGKSMMDRGAPPALTDTAQGSYDEVKALIARWHGRGRQSYAVTCRFALTSTPEQMDVTGALVTDYPDVFFQTHLSENLGEIAAAMAAYPQARDYTDIYDGYGLLGPRALFGHSIHLSARERARLAESGATAVFCPTSNLFLGSGLFDRDAMTRAGVKVGFATDVGGGTSYSMLTTLGAAYQVLALKGQRLTALDAFHGVTRGNAKAIGLDHLIGTLDIGSEADLVVLSPQGVPAMAHRMETLQGDLTGELFAYMILGDDRSVAATYICGQKFAGDV